MFKFKLFCLIIFLFSLISVSKAQNSSYSIGAIYGFNNAIDYSSKGVQFNLNIIKQQKISIIISLGHFKANNSNIGGNEVKLNSDLPAFSFNNLASLNDKLLDGDLSVTYLEIGPRLNLFENLFSISTFYAAGGIGIYFPEYNWDWNTYNNISKAEELENFKYRENNISTGIGFNIRLGFDIDLSSTSKINIESKYLVYNPKIKSNLTNLVDTSLSISDTRSINMNTIFLNVALVIDL